MQVTKGQLAQVFVELGVKTATKWSSTRMQEKVGNLPGIVEEGKECESKEASAVLKKVLKALKDEEEIEVVDDFEAKPAKSKSKADKKADKKKAAKEEESDEDEEDEDEEDAEGDEEEEELAKPAKGKGGKKGGKASKKVAGDKKPGVIASIIEILKTASKDKPIKKDKIVAQLAKRFPDREADAMAKTVNVQVPNRLNVEKELNVISTDKGYYIKA